MADKIVVTPEVLRERARTIKDYKSQQEDVMGRVDNLMWSLGESWRGEAQDVLILKYSAMQPRVKSFQSAIMEFATLAEDTATKFESVDNSIAAKIASVVGTFSAGISSANGVRDQKVATERERQKQEELERQRLQELEKQKQAEKKAAEQAQSANNISTSVKTYNKTYGSPEGNANAYGMTFYGMGTYAQHYSTENFKATNGTQYTSKSACGICSEAMLLSYFGINVKPGDLIDANGGSKAWDGSGVKKKLSEYGVSMKILAQKSKGATTEQVQSSLDQQLAAFAADPTHNGPVYVGTNLASGNHYVLVVGKTDDGKYIIVDPGQGPGGRQTTTIDHIKMVVATSKK